MSSYSEKKEATLSAKIEPSLKRKLEEISTKQDRTLSYVVGALITRALKLYESDGNLKDNDSLDNLVFNRYQHAKHPQELGTVDEFGVLDAVVRLGDPEEVLVEWFKHEGRPMPDGFQVPIFFQGWETYSLDDRVAAIRDFKRTLDRTIRHRTAEIINLRPSPDAPIVKDIKRSLDAVEIDIKPKRSRKR